MVPGSSIELIDIMLDVDELLRERAEKTTPPRTEVRSVLRRRQIMPRLEGDA